MTANHLLFQPEFRPEVQPESPEISRSSSSSAQAFAPAWLRISWNSYGMLKGIEWETGAENASLGSKTLAWAPAPILDLVNRLKDYFQTGKPFGTLPWEWIDQGEWTPFQYQVYSWIAKIPHGETRTYGWVAARIGNTAATRAVGQALKKNPMPIFIPCHRVVAVDSLGGFMGASDPKQPEMTLKRRLLNLEQSYLNPSFSFMQGGAGASVLPIFAG